MYIRYVSNLRVSSDTDVQSLTSWLSAGSEVIDMLVLAGNIGTVDCLRRFFDLVTTWFPRIVYVPGELELRGADGPLAYAENEVVKAVHIYPNVAVLTTSTPGTLIGPYGHQTLVTGMPFLYSTDGWTGMTCEEMYHKHVHDANTLGEIAKSTPKWAKLLVVTFREPYASEVPENIDTWIYCSPSDDTKDSIKVGLTGVHCATSRYADLVI